MVNYQKKYKFPEKNGTRKGQEKREKKDNMSHPERKFDEPFRFAACVCLSVCLYSGTRITPDIICLYTRLNGTE